MEEHNKIKKYYNSKWFFAGIILILIIGGSFYWYEYRPTSIRKQCQKVVDETYLNLLKTNGYYLNDNNQYVKKAEGVTAKYVDTVELNLEVSQATQKDANSEYTKCLHLKSINE